MTINNSLASSRLAEVIGRMLDKGVVVDALAPVAPAGSEPIAIEIRAPEIRAAVAPVKTHLCRAETVGPTIDPVAAAS